MVAPPGFLIIRVIHCGEPQANRSGASRVPPSVKPGVAWHLPHSFWNGSIPGWSATPRMLSHSSGVASGGIDAKVARRNTVLITERLGIAEKRLGRPVELVHQCIDAPQKDGQNGFFVEDRNNDAVAHGDGRVTGHGTT